MENKEIKELILEICNFGEMNKLQVDQCYEEIMNAITLCTATGCVKGKVLKGGTTVIMDCNVCKGRGFR